MGADILWYSVEIVGDVFGSDGEVLPIAQDRTLCTDRDRQRLVPARQQIASNGERVRPGEVMRLIVYDCLLPVTSTVGSRASEGAGHRRAFHLEMKVGLGGSGSRRVTARVRSCEAARLIYLPPKKFVGRTLRYLRGGAISVAAHKGRSEAGARAGSRPPRGTKQSFLWGLLLDWRDFETT